METIIDSKNKLNLYIDRFFNGNIKYLGLLSEIDSEPEDEHDFIDSIIKLKSITSTLIEDLEISKNDIISITTEEEKQRIINQTRKEIEAEREKIQKESDEIYKLKNKILLDQEALLHESKKLDEFKVKLEIADKDLDFQTQAKVNKSTAIFWAIMASILILLLISILIFSNQSIDEYIKLSKNINKNLISANNDILKFTIYFSYFKYTFAKLLIYSLLIYAIVFCVKNYNAQMHNRIINMHKSNAFKSALSLLNTAKSEEGYDQLLLQATQAIFSHQQTGYNGKESEPTNPNLITNIIESATKRI